MNGDKNAQSEGSRIKDKARQLQKAVRQAKTAKSGGNPDAAQARTPAPPKGGSGGDGDAKGGKKGSGKLARLGDQPGQGVGPTGAGSGTSPSSVTVKPKAKAVASQKPIPQKEVLLYKVAGDKKVSIGRIQRSVGTAPLAPQVSMKSKDNSVSVSRSIKFAGMKAHSFTDKQGEHIQFQCQQFLGEVNTNCGALEAATVGPGKRLFVRKINPATLGGAIFQESKNWQRYEIRNLEFTYVATCDADDSGSLYMQYQADPTIPHVDTGVDEVSHASTLGAMVTTTVYTQSPVTLKVNPKELTKNLSEQTGNITLLTTDGYFIVSVLDDVAKNLECGDIFVSYDIVFSEKMLSYSVSDTQDSQIFVSYSASGFAGASPNAAGFTDAFTGDPGFPPASAAVIYMWIENPPTDGPLYSGTAVCRGWRQKGAASSVEDLQWFTMNDLQLRPFENGQQFRIYLNTSAIDGSVDWENGTIGATFYAADEEEDDDEWKLGLSAVAAGVNVGAEMYFDVHWEPLNNVS